MVICTRDHHCSFPSLFFFFFVPFPFLGFISGILLDVLHVCINTSNEISCNLYSFCARRLYTFIMLLWWFIIWDWHDAMWWFLVEDKNNITSHSTPKEMYIILDSAVYIVLFFFKLCFCLQLISSWECVSLRVPLFIGKKFLAHAYLSNC